MGEIDIPESVPTIYHESMGGWLSEKDWIERFNIKYSDPKYIKFYQGASDLHFVAFFTTGTEDHPRSWRHIMRVAVKVKHISEIPGTYIEVKSLARFGITDDTVKDIKYIEKNFSNDDEIKLISSYEVPTVFIGDVTNYFHMLSYLRGSLSNKMKGVKL